MWMTPIMWQSNMIGEKYQRILKLNPMYYIVNGYRESMLSKEWFWEHYLWSVYFWILIVALMFVATKIFKRLKPHFADVL